MKIEFVNHSSFIVRSGEVNFICDPWLEGTSFDDGWALLCETKLPYDAFYNITHLWFSHEHPDHFSPFCIRKIPEDARKNITVYFQKTGDHKVVEYCKKMNFKDVIEVPRETWFKLGSDFDFMCCDWEGFDDSWSYIRTPEARILNLNDCMVNTQKDMQGIKNIIGPVDILFTQFSISAWDGNAEEIERRREGARKMLARTVEQANFFGAKYVVPFASFIWFCHEENHYMNEAFLPIEEVYQTLKQQTQSEVILMSPGDVWTYGQPYDAKPALEKYKAEQASLPSRQRIPAKHFSEQDLVQESHEFCKKIAQDASPSKLKLHLAKNLPRYRKERKGEALTLSERIATLLAMVSLNCEPARLYITDLNKTFLFDIFKGLRPVALQKKDCDVALSSGALWYGLKFLWGGEALHINGRFHRIQPGGCGPLFHFFNIAGEQNAGMPITWKSLPRDIIKRLGYRS